MHSRLSPQGCGGGQASPSLKLSTLNVNGMGGGSKRRAIFNLLRGQGNDVSFIQETHSTRERERIWSSEWGGRAYFAHGSSGVRGVATLLSPSTTIKVQEVLRDPEGRYLLLQAQIEDWPVSLLNVYAPTADHPDDQIGFLDTLERLLNDLDISNLVIGGDFNCCPDPIKDRFSRRDGPESTSPSPTRARLRLRQFADELEVSDIWRLLHPEALQFTFRRSAYSSRLDFWLISEHLTGLVRESEILPAALSDHSSVSLSIQSVPTIRGPGVWKFDNSLLLDSDFVLAMIDFLRERPSDDSLSSPHIRWDFLKYEIRKFCIDFARKTGSKLKSRMNSLSRELRGMEERNPARSPDEEELYRSMKRELADLELLQANKIIFRARANWAQQGERPNKSFLSMEKRRAKTNTLNQVMDDRGGLTSNPSEILDLTRSFYDNLYSAEAHESTNLDNIQWHDLDIPKISDIHRERLEEAYSERELFQALQKLHKGKTPGSDGLSADFYLKFWDFIKKPLLASLDFGLQIGELSTEQRRGIITLIPKKSVDRRQIRNWRPISLLNTDNKILTKAMSIRLQPVLSEILHSDQTGFLNKRYIGENLRTIQDVIDYTNATATPALLLALDFRKAFDSVRWEFLFRACQEFGFGVNFLNGVKTIFKNIESCTTNSGFTSKYFRPGRGVRQGCCVAPYLFLIVAEILAIQIRQSHSIRGISVGDCEVKISQFADDMTAFVQGRDSVHAILDILDSFGSASGLRINLDKSQLLLLGPLLPANIPDTELKTVNRVKILGIWFASNRSIHDHYEWNFKDTLSKMRSICTSWRNRNLSTKGKVAVVNFLVISLLHYVAANSELPHRVLHELKKMVVHFLWNGGSSKIAYSTLIQPIEDGGLKLADFETRIRASRLMWVRRILLEGDSFLQSYVHYLAGDMGLPPLILGKPRTLPSQLRSSLFYSEVFELWRKSHDFVPATEAEVRWEVLWHNKRISVEGSSIRWDAWLSRGIMRVEDILHPSEGRFLSHLEINERYGLNSSFLDALQIRQSIPGSWRALITHQGRPPEHAGLLLSIDHGSTIDLFTSSPRSLYGALITKLAKHIKAQAKWEADLPDSPLSDEWQDFYKSPFQAARETRLQALQYKVLHRIIPCKHYLMSIRLVPNDLCAFCPGRDTLVHFLYGCPNTKLLWRKISNWIGKAKGPDLSRLTTRDILLGVPPKHRAARTINFISMFTKHFIHRQKLFHAGNLCLIEWLADLKKRLLSERYICALEGKPSHFARWVRILQELG